MICASLALAVLLNCSSASALSADAVASDTIPDPNVSTSYFQVEQAQQPQSVRWDPTRFDSSTAVGIKALLESAIAHGLPYEQLYQNALMVSAYKTSGANIVKSTRQMLNNMLDARVALGETSTESELSSGAAALLSGMDGKALQSIRTVRPTPGSAVTALIVAADLIKQRHIPVNEARDAVMALARASRSDEGLNAVQAVVARNAERGPGMARDALARYVKTSTAGAQKNAPNSKPVTRPPGPPDAS